jgi:hypothetical protein
MAGVSQFSACSPLNSTNYRYPSGPSPSNILRVPTPDFNLTSDNTETVNALLYSLGLVFAYIRTNSLVIRNSLFSFFKDFWLCQFNLQQWLGNGRTPHRTVMTANLLCLQIWKRLPPLQKSLTVQKPSRWTVCVFMAVL